MQQFILLSLLMAGIDALRISETRPALDPGTKVDNLVIGEHKHSVDPDMVKLIETKRSPFEKQMNESISRMFNSDPDKGKITLAGGSPGLWKARPGCETPKVWIYIYGLFRTFEKTKLKMRAMANKSSDDCFFVSAVAPENEEDEDGNMKKMHLGHAHATANLMEHQQTVVFNGNFAWSLVGREGMFDRGHNDTHKWEPPSSLLEETAETSVAGFQPSLDAFWYLMHEQVRLAAPLLGITPDPYSVVMRTRYDILWDAVYYNTNNIIKVFKENPRGRHLGFVRIGTGDAFFGWPARKHLAPGQADYSFITSYTAYETDIAGAYDYDPVTKTGPFPTTARVNSWGYGYSLCGFGNNGNCGHDKKKSNLENAFKDIDPAHAQYCQDRATGEPEAKCCAGGRACPMTMVWTNKIPGHDNIKRKGAGMYWAPANSDEVDPTQDVHLYCPEKTPNFHDVKIVCKTHSGPLHMSNFSGLNLVESNGDVNKNPWPAGC